MCASPTAEAINRLRRLSGAVDSFARRALIASMTGARVFLAWVLAFAFLANVLSPRATIAAFGLGGDGYVLCHSEGGGDVKRPLSADEACRQHCLALAGALLAPQPPAFALVRVWDWRAFDRPSLYVATVATRHADAQPRGPPAAAA